MTDNAMRSPPGAGVKSILSPDSAIRKHPLWQVMDRMWRPSGGWSLVSGMVYAFVIGPAIERPMDFATLGVMAGLIVAMWGLKTAEKLGGVS